MCGIAGWVNFQQSLFQNTEIMEDMIDTLSKRGPDDTNIWGKKHVLFGHKRLVVIDPECGRQPMTKQKEDNSYTICYNGELYNTEDIRKELLKKGYTFRGHSDTEVLLASYMEWKEECVHHLNGIYAFAVWDSADEKLFIARDRLGVKPLFFYENNGNFLFASEIKALLANPEVDALLDQEGLQEIMALGPSRSPGSGVFKGIEELRPAHALVFNRDGLKIWRYWNVKSHPHEDSFEETVEKVRELLIDAVTRQLVSDVPLCTFLSGGLDSSAITAIAARTFEKEGKGHLHTYSIDYEGNSEYFQQSEFQPNADAYWIHLMKESFQTIHHECIMTQEELVSYLQEAVEVRDLPGMADVDSSLLWFCRQINKDFVVSLSGECADEIFGGYPWFYRPEELAREGFPWIRSLDERIKLLRNDWQKKLNIKEYALRQYEKTIEETPVLDGEPETERKRRELFYLNMIWFMTTLLDRKDRMSMGASLEVRVPFADHRLVEYVWNIPWEWKRYGDREKGLLRKSLEDLLPKEVVYRKKSPYPKTHHPKYTKLVKEQLENVLAMKDSILHELFDGNALNKLVETDGASFQRPWYGQLMTGPQLLAYLWQIHIWFEKYRINII
ncbi:MULTISPECIES: asparagine synthase (glutamine-hydrolyzing) [Aeribacillus]|jgi:asparagine synthase (glutamine-hydrolysing)|uniref:asparagine synthase (glutamine-hydrolyzing) n=1 Tax=Aeribacillus TaxID=1055323 RepID=UPI0007B46FB0|nr:MULTISPECIES: asparagine synthase (glutamine-hydrolyzing) [Aeribacillus]KZM54106.1 asparagine synthetase B [Aeribacillus pallidus]MDR9796473.1 asparagine synthase (glutamine-hydrolyzing) [Aeribacillus pallidus]MED0650654.1 asparagine synthase (glutamine-hydrolyzing) [Aeribacillus composti]MED4487052.1 asparagine synthase (glutamine-hydrolyzing) [Aeribacillus pallidus]RZI50143.1 asparagine synthase (glutamine-hydrolyzing) [Aeribacillus pallidus]